MAKKLDVRPKNKSRNQADRDMIQSGAGFNDMVLKTADRIKNLGKAAVTVADKDSDENKLLEKTLSSITEAAGHFESIPRNKLVAAPDSWNPFSKLSSEKKILLAESIYVNGLLQPIVVRSLDAKNKTYQILAGHNRNEAFEILSAVTGDPRYDTIEAKVYDYGVISDSQAQEIIGDTNYVQRSNLPARDKAICIYNKARLLRDRNYRGDIMGIVAEQFGITRTSVFYWKKLVTLIPEFDELFRDGKLKLVTVNKIAGLPQDIQRKLYKHQDLVTNESMKQVKARTKPEEVLSILQAFADRKKSKATRAVSLNIPEGLYDEFFKKYGKYLIVPKEK